LLLSLLRQARSRCRDELIEMLLRRVRKTQAVAKEKLKELQEQHREMEEALIGIFDRVLDTASKEGQTDAQAGKQIRTLLTEQGGADKLAERCQTVSAWHSNNDLPLLWPIHANNRNLLFRLLELMDICSAAQDRALLDALAVVVRHRHTRRDDLTDKLDLGFASPRWQSFVIKSQAKPVVLSRRALEVCVFSHLADALQIGDLYVTGAENFGDYRTQLLPWAVCQPRVAAYCDALGMPQTGEEFVAQLKEQLKAVAAEVDAGFPANSELTIDTDGVPHLKKRPAGILPGGLAAFETEIHARMPERHLLDNLKNSASWTRYTRHFGPPSGADSKFARAQQRYIHTAFAYGCNLGLSQTSRHAPGIAAAETLRRINAQHIDTLGRILAATRR
jgi:hypothetical protein